MTDIERILKSRPCYGSAYKEGDGACKFCKFRLGCMSRLGVDSEEPFFEIALELFQEQEKLRLALSKTLSDMRVIKNEYEALFTKMKDQYEKLVDQQKG